ncbi:MAG: potassium transporter TrkG [Planctomycetota bacterium]
MNIILKRLTLPRESPVRPFRNFMQLVGFLAVISLVLEYGFRLPPWVAPQLEYLNAGLVFCFIVETLLMLLFAFARWDQLRRDWCAWGLSILVVATVIPPQLFLLFSLILRFARVVEGFLRREMRPATVLALSFGILVLAGFLLLLLPRVSADPRNPIHPLEAFFTATSAVCVTGLTVRDTGADFSTLGQMIILSLIQIGGLGILTFAMIMNLFFWKKMPIPQVVAMRDIINARLAVDVKRVILSILVTTAVMELAGAVFLYRFWPEASWSSFARLKWSVFHAVSAFCNAGFSLSRDNLTPFSGNAGVLLTITVLVITGGIGFTVIHEVGSLRVVPPWGSRFFSWFPTGRRIFRLGVHTRLALLMTGILLVVGTVGFLALEMTNVLQGGTVSGSMLSSLFQSVTARTAGFHTIPVGELRDATLILLLILMVIGASPISTGGGVKTVTFAVLLLTVRSILSGREQVEAFRRTIPHRVVRAAIAVTMMYAFAATVCILALAVSDPEIPLRRLFFEVISALSTVGLSTGITAQLSVAGKLILCAAMFAGRVGPLALMMTVVRPRKDVSYKYPPDAVVVG